MREYYGSSQIQVANGGHIPITKVGDITPTFKNVFVSPKLSTSIISVGQLVDDNCDVHFSRNGCLVQDQVLGKFKPGIMYERCQPTLPLIETDPSSDTAPEIASKPSTYQHALCCSMRASHPSDRYSIKLRSDGTLDQYKARLVALENKQEYGVDHEETFAPLVKMTTMRTIIAIVAS
nr:uncharacterized protein LOC118038217 [Populus alba]